MACLPRCRLLELLLPSVEGMREALLRAPWVLEWGRLESGLLALQ